MPVPAIQLFKSVKTLSQLLNFVEDGDFASSLGDIEMSAARDAFDSVPDTVDKRGQVWTCISHLNSAQHAYEAYIRSSGSGLITMTRAGRENDAEVKRRFTLILKAVCYRYLGEKRQCHAALELAEKPFDTKTNAIAGVAGLAYLLASAASGLALAEAAYMGVRKIGRAEEEYGVDDTTFSKLNRMLRSQAKKKAAKKKTTTRKAATEKTATKKMAKKRPPRKLKGL